MGRESGKGAPVGSGDPGRLAAAKPLEPEVRINLELSKALAKKMKLSDPSTLQALTACSACFFLNAVRVCQRCERFLCMDCTFSHICRKVAP